MRSRKKYEGGRILLKEDEKAFKNVNINTALVIVDIVDILH